MVTTPSLSPLNVTAPPLEQPLIPTAPTTPEEDRDLNQIVQGLLERTRQQILSSQATKSGSELDFSASQPAPIQSPSKNEDFLGR